MKKFFIVVGTLAVIGAVVGGALYLAFPVQMSTIGGLAHNYILSMGAPAGTTTTESNPAYQAPPSAPAASAASATAGDWPSYNRTVDSDRFSPLAEIDTKNVGKLGGGVITYTAGGTQKVAVAAGFSMLAWPTKPVHAKVVVLGLDSAAAKK
jgi:glucose dehydrogenase